MPSLAIPDSGLLLGGRQGSMSSEVAYPDMFNLTLSESVIEDMIKCVRSGNGLQLSLGENPKIIYGSQTHHLATTEDLFRCEYFRTAPASNNSPSTTNTSSAMAYKTNPLRMTTGIWGVGSQKKFVPGMKLGGGLSTVNRADTTTRSAPKSKDNESSPIAGADAALAALKNSLASEDARKKDNTTKYMKDTRALPPAIQQKGPAQPIKSGNKARFLSQNKASLGAGATRSMPTSPSLTGVGSPGLAPTSVPLSQQQAEKAKAIRRPIVHMLALGPNSMEVVRRAKKPETPEEEFTSTLEKVADFQDGKWTLKPKSYKELDIWSYKKYTPDQRQIAIDNAVRAYDKLRLNSSEPEWNRLLPLEERGTGKSLSKLQAKIATGSIKPAKAPRIKIQGAEDSGRDTGAEEGEDDLFGEKIPTAMVTGGEAMSRSYSNPPATKSKKVSEKEAQTKRLLAKPGKAKSAAAKPEKKASEKESNRIKSSKFVSESDEDESCLIASKPAATAMAKAQSAGTNTNTARPTTSKPAVKRPREDLEDVAPKAKVAKTLKGSNISPQKSSPLASSPPTNASDFEDSSSSTQARPLKRKPADNSSQPPPKRQHQKHSSSASTSSSVASNSSAGSAIGIGGINGVRGYDWDGVGRKHTSTNLFRAYYSKYKELYDELNGLVPNERDREKVVDLRDMYERLLGMKQDILREQNMVTSI